MNYLSLLCIFIYFVPDIKCMELNESESSIEHIYQLLALAKKNNLDMKEFVLHRDKNNYTLLHGAVQDLDLESARFCLEQGADVNLRLTCMPLSTPLGLIIHNDLCSPIQFNNFNTKKASFRQMIELLCLHGAHVSRALCIQFHKDWQRFYPEDNDIKQCSTLLADQLERQQRPPEKG